MPKAGGLAWRLRVRPMHGTGMPCIPSYGLTLLTHPGRDRKPSGRLCDQR